MAKFEFVKSATPTKRFSYVGGEKQPSMTKLLRNDLADTLIMLAGEWDKEPIPIGEAKAAILGCIEQAEAEGAKPQEMHKMKMNLMNIGDMGEIIKYCYNYKLRSAGLAVFKRM